MMDLSDGLHSDLQHILEEAQCGAEIDLTAIPIAEGATLADAVAGGEDYKLLFTADSRSIEMLCDDFFNTFHRPLYPIGRITEQGMHYLREGVPTDPDWQAFAHF